MTNSLCRSLQNFLGDQIMTYSSPGWWTHWALFNLEPVWLRACLTHRSCDSQPVSIKPPSLMIILRIIAGVLIALLYYRTDPEEAQITFPAMNHFKWPERSRFFNNELQVLELLVREPLAGTWKSLELESSFLKSFKLKCSLQTCSIVVLHQRTFREPVGSTEFPSWKF